MNTMKSASAYLRQRLGENIISLNEFYFTSAQYYLKANLPWRALNQLKQCSCQFLSQQKDPATVDLLASIRTSIESTFPRCSCIMIVKNEAANIQAALDSIDDVFDEIVINDTGSIDTTCACVGLYGVTLLHSEWNNNFSEARNTAIDSAHGKWIFWMDADDRFDESSGKIVRDYVRGDPATALSFRIINMQNGNPGSEFSQVRLFPCKPGIRFERVIHEQITPSLVRHSISINSTLLPVIVHTGYDTKAIVEKKALRNIALLSREPEELINDPTRLLSIADNHLVLCQNELAMDAYNRIIETEEWLSIHPDIYAHALYKKAVLLFEQQDFARAEQTLHYCLRCETTNIDTWYLIGLALKKQGRKKEAYEHFSKASVLKSSPSRIAIDSSRTRMKSLYEIADLLLEWKHFDQASQIITKALQLFPDCVDFHAQMGKVHLQRMHFSEATASFKKSLSLMPSNNPDAYLGIASIHFVFGEYERAGEYLKKAMVNNSSSPQVLALFDLLYARQYSPKVQTMDTAMA